MAPTTIMFPADLNQRELLLGPFMNALMAQTDHDVIATSMWQPDVDLEDDATFRALAERSVDNVIARFGMMTVAEQLRTVRDQLIDYVVKANTGRRPSGPRLTSVP